MFSNLNFFTTFVNSENFMSDINITMLIIAETSKLFFCFSMLIKDNISSKSPEFIIVRFMTTVSSELRPYFSVLFTYNTTLMIFMTSSICSFESYFFFIFSFIVSKYLNLVICSNMALHAPN